MAPLAFQTALTGAAAVVTLQGELDLAAVPALESEIDRLQGEAGVTQLVLDLRGLEFLDSSGLRLVALAERRLGRAGGQLVLVRGSETVQRVFEITRMAEHLTFVDSPAALDLEGSER